MTLPPDRELAGISSGPRTESPTVRVARLAARQAGVASRAQLHALGASDGWIARAVRAGRLHRIHPAVFAVGHVGVSVRGRLVAALLYAGPRSALSHLTGFWWLALLPHQGRAGVRRQPPERLDVSARGFASSLPDVRVHHPRDLVVFTYDGLPVTTVPRTLIDAAPSLQFRDLRLAIAEARFRGMLDFNELVLELGRGRRGSAAVRRALEAHMPQLARTRSELERRFVELCERCALPLPEVNVKIAGFTVDMLWRERRLVVELDGHAAHDGANRAEADRGRELALRAAGFRVYRYTWHQVTREPEHVVVDLRAALSRPS